MVNKQAYRIQYYLIFVNMFCSEIFFTNNLKKNIKKYLHFIFDVLLNNPFADDAGIAQG